MRFQHLALHRRMIVVRSLAGAAAGLAPLPYLDDWLVAQIRRGTIRRIAEARGVDLDDAAVRAVAEGATKPPGWRTFLATVPIMRFLRRGVRAAIAGYTIYRRADQASRDFAVATLFDHYCARIHVGGGLDGEAGAALRARIDRAIAKTPSGPLRQTFRAALAAAGRAAIRAPFELADALSGGRIRARLRARSSEDAPEEVAEEALVDHAGTLLGRMGQSVDRGLMGLGARYVSDVVAAFEEDRA
ncbi:MAG TPA: hypothetical protein VKE22_21005 [Haliangiales bacterium]|nr:hypothetical protein [Haliangiales bacterium]